MKTPKTYKMKLFIVHPGIQHAPRLANGALRSGLFEQVYLITSILYKPNTFAFDILKKRIKPIDQEIKIRNNYVYTFLLEFSRFIYNKLFPNSSDQSHNNPIYFWQQIFGLFCLPIIWLNRKNCIVVCFETAGWPVVKYCKKWRVPVIMDFASLSHEKAKELGINETLYGINIKLKERKHINYSFFCSQLCKNSFLNKTSSKIDFLLYLGADKGDATPSSSNFKENVQDQKSKIKISFIANLEYRKGLDILLDALIIYSLPVKLEIHFIGKLRKSWIENYIQGKGILQNITLINKTAMNQTELFKYLKDEHFDLNIQPSRFDSFAMVVPESMMMGIPNIVSPYVGAGELISNGINGFIMRNLDSKSIINVLEHYILMSPSERLELKINTIKAANLMTWENYYGNVAISFKEILKDLKKI